MNFCPRCGARLVADLEGGRLRGICGSSDCTFVHYGSHTIGTGAVVVRDEAVLLIERRSADRVWWQIPGGFVEVDESIDAAVEREVLEETGVAARVVDVLGFRHAPSDEPEVRPANIYVVFRLTALEGGPRPDLEESFDARFFTRAERDAWQGVSAMSRWAVAHAWRPGSDGFRRVPDRPGLQRPGHTIFGVDGLAADPLDGH